MFRNIYIYYYIFLNIYNFCLGNSYEAEKDLALESCSSANEFSSSDKLGMYSKSYKHVSQPKRVVPKLGVLSFTTDLYYPSKFNNSVYICFYTYYLYKCKTKKIYKYN